MSAGQPILAPWGHSERRSANYLEHLLTEIYDRRLFRLGLNVNDLRGTRLFAESRLLALLRSATEREILISTKLDAPLPVYSKNSRHRYWDFFLNSIAGLLVSDHAIQVLDSEHVDHRSDIVRVQSDILAENGGIVSSGQHVGAAIWDRFNHPIVADFLITESITSFEAALTNLLFVHLGLNASRNISIHRVCEFAFEAFQNTREHGAVGLNNEPVQGVRFLSLRRINLDANVRSKLAHEIQSTPFAAYFRALTARWQKHPPRFLLEIDVCDSGVGIAAKLGRAEGFKNVTAEDIATEKQLLLKAFTLTGTSKPRSVAGAGLGLYKVLQATKELDGFFCVRTGRLNMYRHYLTRSNYGFSSDLYSWDQQEYRPAIGTSCTLVFPWW